MNNASKILLSKKTVFTINDMQKILATPNKEYARLSLFRLKKTWLLDNPISWIFTIKDYDIFEFASKLISPSYISFESILQKSGIIFQDYSHTVTVASKNSIKKNIDGINYEYHKLSDKILINPLGILNFENKYMIASPERAVCDMIYLYKNINFDNIRSLSIEKLENLKYIYNKTTNLSIDKLIKNVRLVNS